MTSREFVTKFLEWYEIRHELPEMGNVMKLEQLAEMARSTEGGSLGESIERVIKTYKIKKKTRRKISKYL